MVTLTGPTTANKSGLFEAELSVLCGLNVRGQGNAVELVNEIEVVASAQVNKWVLSASVSSINITKLEA